MAQYGFRFVSYFVAIPKREGAAPSVLMSLYLDGAALSVELSVFLLVACSLSPRDDAAVSPALAKRSRFVALPQEMTPLCLPRCWLPFRLPRRCF
jgi:hypothetical protein